MQTVYSLNQSSNCMTFHGMINPDKETEKKKKILLDNILQYKRSQYTETRDALVHLNDKLQSCRQKTKVEADAIHSIKSRKKELLQKYIDSHVAIAYAKADIMIVEENKNSLFGTRENVCHASMFRL